MPENDIARSAFYAQKMRELIKDGYIMTPHRVPNAAISKPDAGAHFEGEFACFRKGNDQLTVPIDGKPAEEAFREISEWMNESVDTQFTVTISAGKFDQTTFGGDVLVWIHEYLKDALPPECSISNPDRTHLRLVFLENSMGGKDRVEEELERISDFCLRLSVRTKSSIKYSIQKNSLPRHQPFAISTGTAVSTFNDIEVNYRDTPLSPLERKEISDLRLLWGANSTREFAILSRAIIDKLSPKKKIRSILTKKEKAILKETVMEHPAFNNRTEEDKALIKKSLEEMRAPGTGLNDHLIFWISELLNIDHKEAQTKFIELNELRKDAAHRLENPIKIGPNLINFVESIFKKSRKI